MAGQILSGLASGFDWQATIQQLVSAERSRQTPIFTEQNQLTKKQTALGTIKSLLEALKSSANELKRSNSDYYSRTTSLLGDTSSTTSNLSATATGDTPLGDYLFHVIQKATSTNVTGALVGTPLTDTNKTLENLNIATRITYNETDEDDNEFGEFTVNGARVTVRPTDTLASVLTAIGTATGGAVTAALSSDRIVLTAHDIGSGVPPISLGSANDTSNFLEAMKLYTNTETPTAPTVQSSTTLGSLNTNIILSDAMDTSGLTGLTSGAGSFTINGRTINFNVNTSSVRSIINTINNSGAGVLANYDTGTGRLTLTNQATGSTGVALSDTNGLLAALGLTSGAGATTAYGVPARFTINGSSTVLTSNSNTLTDDITGIPGLRVTIKDTGDDTVSVEADTSNARTRINSFIAAYNELNSKITQLTKITVNSANNTVNAADLAGNTEVEAWQVELREILYNAVDTGDDTLSHLYQIGIETDQAGQLSITDQSALDAALEDNPDEVAKIFNNDGDGLGHQLYDYIDNILLTDGTYESQIDTIDDRQRDLTEQIARMERSVSSLQASLYASFQRMEGQQSILQQQQKVFQSIFG